MKAPREKRTAAEDANKIRDFSGLGRGRLIAISKYNCLNLLEIVHYVFRAQCQCSGFPWCFKNVGPTKCLNFRDKKYCKMAGNSRKGKSSPNKIWGQIFSRVIFKPVFAGAKAGTGDKMLSVPFFFSTSRFQGPAFRCDKIVFIVTLLAQMYRWLS